MYCSCEKNSCDLDTFKGVKMIYFPFRMPKNYELRKVFEVLYDLYFIIISSTALDCDVVYSLGYNANILMFFPRLLGKKVMFNMAGLEWERSKFGKMQQFIVEKPVPACHGRRKPHNPRPREVETLRAVSLPGKGRFSHLRRQ